MGNPLVSPDEYSLFIHRLLPDYPVIRHSTLIYIPMGIKFGRVSGAILFPNDIILCVQEFLNFELQVIEGYGYEVSRSAFRVINVPGQTNIAVLHILRKKNTGGMILFLIRMIRCLH